MVEIENISADTNQRHVVLFEESEIVLILRFLPTVAIWVYDVQYKGRSAYGFKLSVGVLHMKAQNFPFDFIVTDENGAGLDPFRATDFITGRCKLYMLEAEDMETIRGEPVEI